MNVIGIYPGNFQPPRKGNYRAYEYLKQITGTNTFVTTTDIVELPNFPLSFEDKQQIWARHGVPIDKIVKVKNPHKAVEITQKFGPDRTVVVFGMIKQEADRFLNNPNGYFLQFHNLAQSNQPLNKHAYILTIPNEVVSSNQNITQETIRNVFSSNKLSNDQKKSFFKQLFGWYDISLYEVISKKFSEANTVKERINEIEVIRRLLKPFIREVLSQLSTPQGDTLDYDKSSLSGDNDVKNSAEIEKEKRNKRTELDSKAKVADMDLKNKKQQLSFFKSSVDKLNRFDIPSATKRLSALKSGQDV